MKFLLVLFTLFMVGCATTRSDYEQGCVDAATHSARWMNFVPPQIEGFSSREEQEQQYSYNLCRTFEEARLKRSERYQNRHERFR